MAFAALDEFLGFTRIATRDTFGAALSNTSTIFGLMSELRFESPVVLPPGRPRLATNPLPTGSLEVGMTMGIVVVALCAALMTGVPDATMRSTFRLTSSAA